MKGKADAELDLETNLAGIRSIGDAVAQYGLPLTADLQDGYIDIEDSIKRCIEAGAVGCNLEDVSSQNGKLRSTEEHVSRMKTAMQAAGEAGVPDFVVNARTDVLAFGGSIEDAIDRGKAYLDAGAVTVYVWGGSGGRGVSKNEVQQLVKGLGGMINVKMNLRAGDWLNVADLAKLGVARISVGPEMYHHAMQGFRRAFDIVAEGGRF